VTLCQDNELSRRRAARQRVDGDERHSRHELYPTSEEAGASFPDRIHDRPKSRTTTSWSSIHRIAPANLHAVRRQAQWVVADAARRTEGSIALISSRARSGW